jgi:hypothetical protein
MSVARTAALTGLLACVAALVVVPAALADLGPIRLVSKSATEQAAEALAPALSADGRYLAFQGTIGGLSGVFREDLRTGALLPVVAADAYEGGPGADAGAPSISADGRYVSFTTKAPLDPVDDPQAESSDVYVADMSTTPPTYQLASALNAPGASCAPGVAGAAPGAPLGLEYAGLGGALASGRVALSADGREVAFVTTAESDLTSGSGGSTPGAPTPAGQVAVRDLDSGCTILVSVERDAGTGAMTDRPVAGGAELLGQLPLLRGAALSADGTTVAWLGSHLLAQVPLLADEAQTISALDDNGTFPYAEPLWRRLADGPGAPTRRIVGGGDPLAAGCPPAGTLADPACQGPFPGITNKNEGVNPQSTGWLGPINVDGVPQLSADGRTVALIGNPTEAANVFLVDMSAGLSRRQAVRQLTRQVSVEPADEGGVVNKPLYIPLNGHVFDLAISADGRRLAFATARQQFPLAPPNLITDPPAQLGLVELYLIDLDAGTLRRVTHGYGGIGEASLAPEAGPQGGLGAGSPSFGDGGRLIAFSSFASNLVAGDGNDASDAFLVEDDEAPRGAGAASISAPPRGARVKRRRRLALSAFSLPDGDVKLVAVVPGSGSLRARAGASLAVGAPPRRLAAARARAKAGGPVAMVLALPRRYRRLARSREGLYATARVAFRPRGGKRLRAELQIRFHAHRRQQGGKG